MGKGLGLFSRVKNKVDTRTAEIEAARAKAEAAGAANAAISDQAKRKRAQGGLLSFDESASVLSSGSQQTAAANKTANSTVLGGGGR